MTGVAGAEASVLSMSDMEALHHDLLSKQSTNHVFNLLCKALVISGLLRLSPHATDHNCLFYCVLAKGCRARHPLL